ncbi:uncharacterized protein N7469_000738 [Penicillium citrinum]|uniref:Protein required for cell viability Rrp17 n=1 Tax=Penicillium citrinum TaxID=5077 RepID=A0A9W9TV08_PENCI|nr:uncharacterized protein N7469_000738 [Penicillium citrinum]KAJ5242411.1 hypothetical protein N7469_000738 [Penicillium citrinum]
MGPSVKRRKVSKTEEVNFDPDARHEFLTGFRKRKQERIKHAQNAAEKRYREERRRDRAKLREDRAQEYKQAMEEHQRQLKRIQEEDGDSSENNPEEDEDEEEWGGIEEPPAVDYEAEYIDEDKYTTVTVEEMDASREGLRKAVRGSDSEEEEEKEEASAEEATPAKPAKKAKKATADRPKKKKRQFRYESKQDRKVNAAKQRLSKSKKAKARREQ